MRGQIHNKERKMYMSGKKIKMDGKLGSKPVEVKSFEDSDGLLNTLDTYVTVKVKRFDKNMPLPEYKTAGAAGCDLYAVEDVVFGPWETRIVKTNIAIKLLEGFEAQIRPRSSTVLETPLIIANSPGTIDSDYSGDNDRIGIIAKNLSNDYYTVHKGDRLAQLIIAQYYRADWQEVDKLDDVDRGGFGSTGEKEEI